MHFTTPHEGQQFPQASISGAEGVLLDTGWDVHWPGPAHIYVSDADMGDMLSPFLQAENGENARVVEVLEGNGWTAPGVTADKVAELEAQLAATKEKLAQAKAAEAGFDAAAAKLAALSGKPAATARPKPAAKGGKKS